MPLFRKFINQIKKGRRVQKNGEAIKKGSIDNYRFAELLLNRFIEKKIFYLRIKSVTGLTAPKLRTEKNYWKDFYFQFTDFMYDDLGHHDNYVGRTMKLLHSFFNYLNMEREMNIGNFHHRFYFPSEDIAINVLIPERINNLVSNKDVEIKLTEELKKIKDVFVFGCTVALRFSDLMTLRKENVERINENVYIKIRSAKTQTLTRVKIPGFAVEILNKYSGEHERNILPLFTKQNMNKKIKILMEHYNYTEEIEVTRNKRGIATPIYKEKKTNRLFRFCDLVTTHTMRRSAITYMLSLGMSEQVVRQISGHTANSKEFYRYVAFAQTFMDGEIDAMHEKFKNKILHTEEKCKEIAFRPNFLSTKPLVSAAGKSIKET